MYIGRVLQIAWLVCHRILVLHIDLKKKIELQFLDVSTWGVHVLRSPNFFLGNGSR